MGILNDIKALRDEAVERKAIAAACTYKWERDEHANLHVTYDDGYKIKLPVIPFRPYQLEVQIELFTKGIKRFLLERPRRSGKEVESWNLILQGAITEPGLYMMVYPTNVRARAVLWDGAILMPDGKSVKFKDMIPKRLVQRINNQDMKITLVNGSIIWIVGSDIDPDKLRGTNPRAIVYAEFAFQDPKVFYIMLPVLRQNGGWLICQSTFDGMNHFYHLIENNKSDPLWYCRVDSIENLVDENGNRYITDEMIDEDRRAGMPEYLIQQEYYGVVQVNQETKYFAHAIKNIYDNERLIVDLMIANTNVYTAWDIGMNDCTAITIFQLRRVDNYLKPIVIGYIENNNRDLAFYIAELRRFCAKYNLNIKEHFFPHDAKKREFNTGRDTLDYMSDMGERAFFVPRPQSKQNTIEAMRRLLYFTSFNKTTSMRLIDCLSNYSKEYDDKMGTYKNNPLHNWASHGVDSFQTMTLALEGGMICEVPYDTVYIN